MGNCCMGDEAKRHHDPGFEETKLAQTAPPKLNKPLVLGSLNYGGIINSPFEFYIAEMKDDL